MSGNRRSGKQSVNESGTSSGSGNKKQLNDGRFRLRWKAPETDEEWSHIGKTRAHQPITYDEELEYNVAWWNYKRSHNGDTPHTYDESVLLNQDSNPSATQVMPSKLKASCRAANEDIERLSELWKDNRQIQIEKQELLDERKRQLRVLQAQIRQDEAEINGIKETYTSLEEEINKKADWIISCQQIYPH